MKVIIVSLALIVCWVSCDPSTTTAPFVKLSCKGHKPNGFFVDEKDPKVFHQCSHGQHVGTFQCKGETIFDEKQQVCVNNHIKDKRCPRADGLFRYPGNPHKFIACHDGYGEVKVCPAELIFDENQQKCVYNNDGVTWDTDAPTQPTRPPTAEPTTAKPTPPPTAEPTTAKPTRPPTAEPSRPPTVVPSTSQPTKSPTVAPGQTTKNGGTPQTDCKGTGYFPDPNDRHKYFICKNGKRLHVTCPDGLDFDPVIKQCS